MAWVITLNNLPEVDRVPQGHLEYYAEKHPLYPTDIIAAFHVAKEAGFTSCVITGFRTPNPLGTDEVCEIGVRGMTRALDFNEEMKRIIASGPDSQ